MYPSQRPRGRWLLFSQWATAGDGVGDISITPVVASWHEPRDCFRVGRGTGRAIAMPRTQPSRRARGTTAWPGRCASRTARARRRTPRYCFWRASDCWFATHSAVSPRSAGRVHRPDDAQAQSREADRRRPLLLSSGVRLLVRHGRERQRRPTLTIASTIHGIRAGRLPPTGSARRESSAGFATESFASGHGCPDLAESGAHRLIPTMADLHMQIATAAPELGSRLHSTSERPRGSCPRIGRQTTPDSGRSACARSP